MCTTKFVDSMVNTCLDNNKIKKLSYICCHSLLVLKVKILRKNANAPPNSLLDSTTSLNVKITEG
jgi:hypothetical protein